MPLKEGSSEGTISANIATELRAHPSMDPKQAAAIAYSKARGDSADWRDRLDGCMARIDGLVKRLDKSCE